MVQVGWNASVPECVDTEPPTFQNCPAQPIVIGVDQNGQLMAADFTIPQATDNSGFVSWVGCTHIMKLVFLFIINHNCRYELNQLDSNRPISSHVTRMSSIPRTISRATRLDVLYVWNCPILKPHSSPVPLRTLSRLKWTHRRWKCTLTRRLWIWP